MIRAIAYLAKWLEKDGVRDTLKGTGFFRSTNRSWVPIEIFHPFDEWTRFYELSGLDLKPCEGQRESSESANSCPSAFLKSGLATQNRTRFRIGFNARHRWMLSLWLSLQEANLKGVEHHQVCALGTLQISRDEVFERFIIHGGQ